MSQCQICNLNKSDRLEAERRALAGGNFQQISRDYSVSAVSLRNHMDNHVSRQLAKSQEMKQAIDNAGLVSEIEDLLKRSKGILRRAERDGKLGIALGAIRETRGTLELMAKICATIYQIQAQELQAQQMQQEDSSSIESQEGLKRLSDAELSLLIALYEKIAGERTDDVVKAIINEHRFDYDDFKPKRGKHRNVIPGYGYVEDVPEDEDDYEDELESEDTPEVILDPSPNRITRRRAVHDDPEALETLDDLSVSPLEGVDLSSVKRAGTW
jgi:hypothetical protein